MSTVVPPQRPKTQQELEEEFRKLRIENAAFEADEERRVHAAIAPAVREHERILARSRELMFRPRIRSAIP